MNKKYAAIDIGSNTVQMLIAEYDNEDKLVKRENHLITTRLGDCLPNGDLASKAIADTASAIAEFTKYAKDAKVDKIRILATSAARDADNKNDFLAAMKKVTDTQVEIIDGAMEAMLSYKGACASVEVPVGSPVIDSGGSSTELICELENGPIIATSIDIGAVRAKKNGWSVKEIRKIVRENFSLEGTNGTAVGVAGTITAIAGVLAGLEKYDRAAIEGMIIKPTQLRELLKTLSVMDIKERCAYSPLLEKRGEIIQQGLEIWIALCNTLHIKKIVVCGGGILDGAISDMI